MLGNFFASFLFEVSHDKIPSLNISYDNIFYVNPLLNILGYSFYDIEYYDGSAEKKEMRIFYKGHLDIGDGKYKLFVSNKNLNFLQKEETT